AANVDVSRARMRGGDGRASRDRWQSMSDYRLLPAGDTAVVVELGDTIDRRVSALVLELARRIDELGGEGIVETVPTFRSVMVHSDPARLTPSALAARLDELMRGLQGASQSARVWRLPACYHATIAPDLADVAARLGLSPRQLIERHCGIAYHVY